MPKLTIELLAKLEAWKNAGDRTFSIEFKRDDPGTLWVYDYKLRAGMFISGKNADADWDVLIVQETRKDLLDQLNEMDGGVVPCQM